MQTAFCVSSRIPHRTSSTSALCLVLLAVWESSLHVFIVFVRNGAVLFRAASASTFPLIDVFVKAHAKLHRHLLSAAPFLVSLPSLLVGPGIPDIRAQNDFLRFFALPVGFLCVTGAFRLLPVARLYFSRPFAVRPAPWLVGRFSPRPTDRFGALRLITCPLYALQVDGRAAQVGSVGL